MITHHPTRNLTILVILASLSIAQWYVDGFTSNAEYWKLNQLLSELQGCIVLWLFSFYISYKLLLFKTIVTLWAVMVTCSLAVYCMWLIGTPFTAPAMWIKSAAVVFYGIFLIRRSYRIKSDPIEAGNIYLVRRIPDSTQDFLVSLVTLEPFGGTGVICDGHWYHFHRGIFVRSDIRCIPLDKCVILKSRPERLDTDKYALDQKLGEKWTWRHNCLTVLYRKYHK